MLNEEIKEGDLEVVLRGHLERQRASKRQAQTPFPGAAPKPCPPGLQVLCRDTQPTGLWACLISDQGADRGKARWYLPYGACPVLQAPR
jgi:hypothetical protein